MTFAFHSGKIAQPKMHKKTKNEDYLFKKELKKKYSTHTPIHKIV